MPANVITFRPDGMVEFVNNHDAGLASGLGEKRIRRASYVEPISMPLRLAFHAIRGLVRDESRLAAWTRSWACLWRVRVIGGPTFGEFSDRQAAIAAEVAWLEENRL